jgi:hypothetical protein
MVVRERDVLDVGRLVADGLKLRLERLCNLDETLRDWTPVGFEIAIGDHANVPHHRSFGVRDQKTGHGHL